MKLVLCRVLPLLMPAGVNNKPVGNCAIIQIDEFLVVEIVRLQISCFKLKLNFPDRYGIFYSKKKVRVDLFVRAIQYLFYFQYCELYALF